MNDQLKEEKSASVDAVLSNEWDRGNTRNGQALDDDNSTRSSDSSECDSSSSSTSSSPSSLKSPPPSPISTPKRHNKSNHFQLSTDEMTGDQIRQNAWELLQANASDIRANSPPPKQYQSYHDAPTISSMHRTNQFQNDSFHNGGGIANNPNANSGYYETSGDLSFQNVASMALSCIAHCLTEGYRAASTYYTGESTQHSPMRSDGNYHENYHHAGSYYSDNYNDGASGNNSTNWEADSRNKNVNISGYSGSYQNKETAKQTTLPQSTITKEVEENSKQKVRAIKESTQPISTEPQGEYASVAMPATYQGGSKVMG